MAPILLFCLLAFASPEPSWPIGHAARAVRNYQAVMRGQVRIQDLSPIEQAEVREVDRQIRAQRAASSSETAPERCRRDREHSGGSPPSDLQNALTDLICGPDGRGEGPS